LVLFAGAGISTETTSIFKTTLYTDIADEMKIPSKKRESLDFPTLMSTYCERVNGRRDLLEWVKYRFDYCHQYPELYHSASRFHRELSSIHQITEIFTTNWDDYFERECGAVPFVTSEDFAFYNMAL